MWLDLFLQKMSLTTAETIWNLITKAELLQVGIFFPHPFICMRNFITKKKVRNRRNEDHLVFNF